jgi:hypothetical protein
MTKTVERLITVGAIAALVVVFFYQVAYGATASNAAKEAYDFGFGLGKADGIQKYFSIHDAVKQQHER